MISGRRRVGGGATRGPSTVRDTKYEHKAATKEPTRPILLLSTEMTVCRPCSSTVRLNVLSSHEDRQRCYRRRCCFRVAKGAVLCCAVLCCAVLCCAALCCAVVTLTHQQRHAEHCTNYLTEQNRCFDACGQRAATVSVVAVRKVSRAAPFTGAGRSPDQLEAPPQFMS